MSLAKKYEPKKISDIVGQDKAIQYILYYFENFPKTYKKALLVYGPTGCGKTSIIKAIANEKNFELIELNASDYRNAEAINSIILPASQQQSLFSIKKIILIDEIEGLHGQNDRGGFLALIDVIKKSKFPIVLTAQDAFDERFKSLRNYCELLELLPLNTNEILKKLKYICEKENITYEMAALHLLALHSNGDLRAAINDLQMLVENKKELKKEQIVVWGREQKEELKSVLRFIFKSFDPSAVLNYFDHIEDELEDLFLWIEQNLPYEYNAKALSEAYKFLSDAYIFLNFIKKRQHWRFFVYAKYLGLIGVQQSKKTVNSKNTKFSKPDLLFKFYMLAAKKRKAQVLAEKYAEFFHTSAQRLQQTFLPYYAFLQEKGKRFGNLEIT